MEERQLSVWEDKLHQFPTPYHDLVDMAPCFQIQNAFIKNYRKIHGYDEFREYKKILVAISGGSDSDILIDMIERIGYQKGTVKYVFYNTGIEFQATKNHIKELEKKYGVTIEENRAKTPTTIACKKYGQPFLSKRISDYMYRLQRNNFKWEDEDYTHLIQKYPKCKAAIKWWCNEWGEGSQMNINRRKYLKEFIILNPPNFSISDKCCQKSKKDTAHDVEKKFNPDLSVLGLRKGEGGVRSTAFKSCFDEVRFGCSRLRPIFWFLDEDKRLYCETYDVYNSECYSKYGLKRTGCACCPFGKDFEAELEAAKKYEPSLYKVAISTFGESYEYTRKYISFVNAMKNVVKTKEKAPEENNYCLFDNEKQ